jgi:deoxyhypusine synthase
MRNMNGKQRFPRLDVTRLRMTRLQERPSKVSIDDVATPPQAGESFVAFWDGLPDILAVRDLRRFVADVAAARRQDKPVAMGMGGHVIKTGLGPVLIDLMRAGVLSAVASNGSVCVHDVEIALGGKTSEDVESALRDGSFGMSQETAAFILDAVERDGPTRGLGTALGEALLAARAPYAERSVLAQGAALGVPVTIHVALGTDIIHMHPRADGPALGVSSMRDFRTFTDVVAALTDGGVYINVGSAVIMPEVFLKALSVARNLGYRRHFTTANFDFIQQYRPATNVVGRPHADGGRGYNFIGHHEIMIPLFAAALKNALA